MKKRSKIKIFVALAIILLLLALAAIAFEVLGRRAERRTYRLSYPEEIISSSAEFELDPYLVAAIIHCESSNLPDAISRSGAVGLMQVMPETGGWIAGKLKIDSFSEEDLTDPTLNIRFGCWYLRFLMDRYDEDWGNAIAAYNAGHGNVDKWLADPEIASEGKLTNIPFVETDNYVEKVQRAYEKYKTLYPGDLEPADGSSN